MAEDDERVVVKTYVPRSQKEAWVDHAESLGMSQSEFLRTMVQSGRRGFDPDPVDTDSRDATPGGEGLEERVLAMLSETGVMGWEELTDRLTEGVERDLDEALGTLQDRGAVRYNGRHGGYVVAGERPSDDGQNRRPGRQGSDRTPEESRTPRDSRSGEDRREPAERVRPDRERERPQRRSGWSDERGQTARRPAEGRRPTDGRADDPPADDWGDDRRVRDDRPRSPDRPRRDPPRRDDGRERRPDRRPRPEDEQHRVDALREVRESLDGSDDGREQRSPSDDDRRRESVTDEDRYDEY